MIALISLDDRPCNVRFPQQIAAIGGEKLITPPIEYLGRFHTAGQYAPIERWLYELPPVEALIVSVDMLAYGGLVASRKPTVPVELALERLEAIRAFRTAHPQTPIYAFNILMRLAITMSNDEAVANYYNIMRYARLCDEAERFDSAHLRDELAKVTAEIPPRVLDEYLAARARNHAVNSQMIDWLADGVFDYLLITQEDATEFGLHRQEQDRLLAHVHEHGVEDKMSLHPGADEAALTLLARHWNTGVRFQVHPSGRDDMKNIAPFEDRPYEQALQQHVAAMRGTIVEETDDVDFHLFVNAPVGISQKDEEETARAARAAKLISYARELETVAAQTNAAAQTSTQDDFVHLALCDVAFPNGADNVLMTELEKRGVLGKLSAYAGWNTAGNTTGTVLAQCAAIKYGLRAHGKYNRELNRQFVFERLVDDWFYQAQVRARIEKSAREQDISPLNMEDQGATVEAQARRELRGFAQLLAKRHFGMALQNSEITLPWSRTFEADVRVELA